MIDEIHQKIYDEIKKINKLNNTNDLHIPNFKTIEKYGENPKIYLIGNYPSNQNLNLKDKGNILYGSNLFVPDINNTGILSDNLKFGKLINKNYQEIVKNELIKLNLGPDNEITKNIEDINLKIFERINELYEYRAENFIFPKIKEYLKNNKNVIQLLNLIDILKGNITKKLKDNKLDYDVIIPNYVDLKQDELFKKMFQKYNYKALPLKLWNIEGAKTETISKLKEQEIILNNLETQINKNDDIILKGLNEKIFN